MAKITIVGLGYGNYSSLTLSAAESIKKSNRLYFRTKNHEVADYLKGMGKEITSYDYVYEESQTFDQVYEIITNDLIENANRHNEILYCAPGNPVLSDKVVQLLLEKEKKGLIKLDIIGSISIVDEVLKTVKKSDDKSLKIVNALDIGNQYLDINSENIIINVYDQIIASEIKLYISEIYGDEFEIYVLNKNKEDLDFTSKKVLVYEIDRLTSWDHKSCLFIPAVDYLNKQVYNLHDLITIMKRLRGKNGCPWDMKQTHSSLREYVLEEAYEVVEAINNDDSDNLAEELGDLLLQVIFHSQIAKEEGTFNLWDVIAKLSSKLINRHPHVFGEVKVDTANQVRHIWENIKDKEKNIESYAEGLENIPKGLSALMRSHKIQKKVAKIGFDWDNINQVLEKVKEEFRELEEAIENNDQSNIEEELGDLLFAVVNLSRFCKVNPETSLINTIEKFIFRFKFMEEESKKQDRDLKEMTLKEMNELWNLSKIHKNLKKDKK